MKKYPKWICSLCGKKYSKKQFQISMNREELIEEVFRQIYVPLYPVDKPIYEMTFYEQGLYKQVRIIAIAILAGISKKQEVSFDKEKTAILNELVNGTGKK